MMKKYLALIFIFSISFSCFSASNLSYMIKRLKASGVDSIITLKIIEDASWANERVTNDTCSTAGYYKGVYINTYVIWKKKGQCYFTKIHPCINYEIFKLKDVALFLFIDNNISYILKEKIYPENYGTNLFTFHEGYINRTIDIYLKKRLIHFSFDQTDLQKEHNPKYFNHNLKLKRIRLTKMLLEKLRAASIQEKYKTGLSLW